MPNVRGIQPLLTSLILMVATARFAETLEYPQHMIWSSPKSRATQHVYLFNPGEVTFEMD
jgi:hypothetical protein